MAALCKPSYSWPVQRCSMLNNIVSCFSDISVCIYRGFWFPSLCLVLLPKSTVESSVRPSTELSLLSLAAQTDTDQCAEPLPVQQHICELISIASILRLGLILNNKIRIVYDFVDWLKHCWCTTQKNHTSSRTLSTGSFTRTLQHLLCVVGRTGDSSPR